MLYAPYGPTDYSLHFLHICLQLYFVASYIILQTTTLSLYFAIFYYIRAFCEDFRLLIDRINTEITNTLLNVEQLIIEAIKFEKKIIK